MKSLWLILVLLISCSQNNQSSLTESFYKEALLRSRSISAIDRNLDFNNPIEINFYNDYADQLIELSLTSKPMNTSSYSVVNSDPEAKRKSFVPILLGRLKIELDGEDITECAIQECNSTNCLGENKAISEFSGEFNTSKVFLNLTKMAGLSSSSCSQINFGIPGTLHRLTLKEGSEGTGTLYGARLIVQLISYNRTLNPQNILNVIE